MRYITFALAKGRLADKTMALFGRIGIHCDEMKEKSRRLIFINEECGYKFFLAKAGDVPTYVEYGAADVGVAGKDTLLEENRNLYEVADLGFGRCRMVVAGQEDKRQLFEKSNNLRVATKYPEIARSYFYNRRMQTVEIIKLNGSVELGPMVGLADVIVDIVETGSTLNANGLCVFEEICPISARVVVNSVSMKMEYMRINSLIDKLKKEAAKTL